MKANIIVLFIFSLFVISCTENKPKELSAVEIVDRAIENAGGDKYENINLSFTFRDKEYRVHRKNGAYEYSRIQKDTLGRIIKNQLSNTNFSREIDDKIQDIPNSLADRYKESVNSVVYFALLPYGLNAAAVHKKKLQNTMIEGKEYYKIKVTFSEDGGGSDYEDEYIYYINKKSFNVDYLSYNFKTNNGGSRFRKAVNPRIVKGVRFVDYLNYKSKNETLNILDFDKKFQEKKLELVSEIKLENIKIQN